MFIYFNSNIALLLNLVLSQLRMEILPVLRKKDFPDCVIMALDHIIGKLNFNSSNNNCIPGLADNSDEHYEQIVQEIIFGGANKNKMSPIQSLIIVDILHKYFKNLPDEVTCITLYKIIFQRTIFGEQKYKIIRNLLPYAIATQNKNVLNAAAIWIQTNGCNSDFVLKLFSDLLTEHMLNHTTDLLNSLPSTSAIFTCSLLTIITHLHTLPEFSKSLDRYKIDLLRLVCFWLELDPMVCLATLEPRMMHYLQNNKQTLWTSPTKPNNQTPVSGLVKWSISSSFSSKRGRNHKEQDGRGVDELTRTTDGVDVSEVEVNELTIMESHLHFLILQTISRFPSLASASQLELITLADMMKIIHMVSNEIQTTDVRQDRDGCCFLPAHLQTSVDRVAQVLQVALHTGAFRCSLVDLQAVCRQLPDTRLMMMIKKQHLQVTPPPMHNVHRV